ncbi:hypothetical protein E3N88_43913 [Mikania micrantha]|uniref:MULE transposase domain-containing protein n=1 Tax=Mikania micrantha TaxID=192012 RepID=A0A5N6LDK1_9ASTR|nr:hypothetical protein E3N88_43913 [Mikania micrantha]
MGGVKLTPQKHVCTHFKCPVVATTGRIGTACTISFKRQIFISVEELMAWVKSKALDNRYVVVTGRSKKKKGTDEVRNDKHNHEPAQNLEGHPFVRRLSEQEQNMVYHLTEQHIEPRNILFSLKKQNPDIVSIRRYVYNVQQKFKNKQKVGSTPMQVLENLLHTKNYVYYNRENSETNVVEEIFFSHKKSYTWWRAFPHVLMIDVTYKTNMYKLLFVQIVCVTSTHHTFCIAHAFVSKEKEENYHWVLERVKYMLDKCMEPRVIITDRDLALMNACHTVFPHASMYLCRWHISENIAKHCKASFSDGDWKKFKGSWGNLCDSSSPEIYDYNYNRLYQQLVTNNRQSKGR